ncbi:uncharacterized protein LOC131299561 [Rhododendron vialii]|uniref:uncharacterized protein LOC131299561 n=1 Tax=Rhododendron vialii TaxID=182163 RepID=UPI00265D666E|nr:uncharacterized protein LOC131299561 [Rhododendron vialii]
MAKNDKERVTAHCKRFNIFHDYGHVLRTPNNPRATSELIGSLVVEDVRAKSKKRPVDVVTDMKKDYGLNVTYHQAWWGVEKARGDVFGDYEISFSSLKWYVSAAKSTNPGSHIELEIDEEMKRFKRLFVAFGECINGFNHCRPLLFLDGTHLKGRQRGHLLAATGKDGNQANRNQGLLEAVRMVFPNSCHGYCLFHLKWNLRHHLRGTQPGFKAYLINLMLRSAYAPTQELFYDNMHNLIADGGNQMSGFLSNLQLQHWANAFFPSQRYGEMYSHVAESFNSWIEDERYLPIKPLVDAIRVKVMNLIVERREIASKWAGKICPQMDKKLTDRFYDSRTWVVSESGYGVYEVHAQPIVTVDIGNRSCSCKQWQQDGFPCCHAVGTITSSVKYLVDYVDPYYYSQTFRDSYCVDALTTN